MKRYLLAFILLSSLQVYAQSVDSGIKKVKEQFNQLDKERIRLDSVSSNLDSMIANQTRRIDSATRASQAEQYGRNMDAFMAGLNERNAKQKQRMWIRIGIGVLLLVILIIGLRRRKKTDKITESNR